MLATESNLRTLATEVRETLLELVRDSHVAVTRVEDIFHRIHPARTSSFPSQWCDFASVVLAGHIARQCPQTHVLICTGSLEDVETGEERRHWWCECNGFAIDITCDQFENAPAAPFVARRSMWHDREYPTQRRF